MSSISQNDVLLRMSYLLGEQSIPTTGIEDRKQFINDALGRIYRSYNFNELQAIATVTVTAGAATLPSDIGESPSLDVRVINAGSDNDYVYEQIAYEDQDKYVDGDYKYWLTGSAGSYTLNTKDSQGTLIVRYMQDSPAINASVSTTFPSAMTIARGALVYFRLAENPDADTSQDEAFFQRELQEVIARQNRNRPIRRSKSIMELNNHFTGRV